MHALAIALDNFIWQIDIYPNLDSIIGPVLKKNGMWYIPTKGFNSQRSPSTNIHYNSQKHWVTTFQYENGDIYLLDSDLGKKMDLCLNDSWTIQLAQMYGHGKSKLKVYIPQLQQQNNGYDCGLFAIANMMEFIANRYTGLQEGKLEFEFIQCEMREHLVKCFNQQYMEPFPKKKI